MGEVHRAGEGERVKKLASKLIEVHTKGPALVYEHVVASLLVLRLLLRAGVADLGDEVSYGEVMKAGDQVILESVDRLIAGQVVLEYEDEKH